MTINEHLIGFSTAFADLAASAGASVIQVRGGRRAASGVVHGADTVVTTTRAIGREDRLHVTRPDGSALGAELAGWDPANGVAVLRTASPLELSPPSVAEGEPRIGEAVLAVARSWSNAPTVSPGTVAVIGGPLRTGRRREIARVIRITAAMHDGFAGGGVFDVQGRLAGIATASSIRGFGVVIPASIAWASAAQVLTSGTPHRGFLGVAVQPVKLSAAQQATGRERGLLVMGITQASPAEAAGLMVGDVLLQLDDHALEGSEDLLDLLTERRIGQTATLRVLRGNSLQDTAVTIARRS